MPRLIDPEIIYVERHLVDEEGCWIFVGSLNNKGYGKLNARTYAHVAAWEEVNGPVPDGLELDHTCRKPACINPDHLEPVTHAENNRRARLLVVGQCRRGHEIQSEADLYIRPDGTGAMCLRCQRMREANRRKVA